ncbi:MAG: TrpR-like protein YerC/YecD [Candidatus Peregrinibacteria bacterium GW2011_GWF2_33_10]|nr:MAG: TrpR-like protein YerC/YecD [Candidatus Peregrinibacteria bacterium GW2011_GWF2_33_10]OGJ43970.1 MAG: hypothetical protein A2272_05050 [Candidatus Peregrinibacteria bacterium RIFOXYA12_FULL_33_12]OGJ45303.1 MAG: hypothetical protein A2263_03445 [Candidatus Peregrinibacteria bacterium RIFOXYA2_FULL_33_21]
MEKRKNNQKYANDFFELFVALPNKEIVNQVMEDFFTLSELEAVAQRWQIVKMLEQGISQRQISEKLGVGIATITHGSQTLKQKGDGFRWLLGRNSKLRI